MRPLATISVRPALPVELADLETIAYNLWWTWSDDATELFARVDHETWSRVGHNPIKLLGTISQDRLNDLADDPGFRAHLGRVAERLTEYLAAERPATPDPPTGPIAYFSLEFGIHESLPIYSGGMGLLAGDHIKSASDLGLPFHGVTLLYREGYFRQYLNQDGWQLERYYDNEFASMPLRLVRDGEGNPLTIGVDLPGRVCRARVWELRVGRVPLYLLDANVPENTSEDREITRRLYQGDTDMRIRQEILLGVGGVRALSALGIDPVVCHMNEGHAAFLAIERTRRLMAARGLTFHEARELAAAGNVFTTHTPVPAGIDVFPHDLIDRYFDSWYAELGLDRGGFLALGRQNPFDNAENFSMAVLAIRMAEHVNGVSKLHGSVSRRMWRSIWPDVPVDEVPIGSVTNGVHSQFWASGSEISRVYDRYLGPSWREESDDPRSWRDIEQVPSEELWRATERDRGRLVSFVRSRLRRQAEDRGATLAEIETAGEALDPSALTVGFARRFATYKRALLLFRDAERLVRLMTVRGRPIQFIIAGKAHPQDMAGRELIRALIHAARRPEFVGKIVFVENYDIEVARHLVQGVDVWLTNPRRPFEASGTSGMKVAVNGGLNVSIRDGWWVEAYRRDLGWAIGQGEELTDADYQDDIESRALYDLLEMDVVPLFYNRGVDGVPREWVSRVKASISALCPYFSTHRMVREYLTTAYAPATSRFHRLEADNAVGARAVAAFKSRMWQHWGDVKVRAVSVEANGDARVGQSVDVAAVVETGALSSDDIRVEFVVGAIDSDGAIVPGSIAALERVDPPSSPTTYRGSIVLDESGQIGYAVRVLPNHPELAPRPEPGLVRWA